MYRQVEKEGRQGGMHHTGRVAPRRVILLSHFLSVATISQWQSLHHFRKLESQHPHLETRIPAAEGGTDGNNEAVRVTAINQLFPYGLEHFTVFPPHSSEQALCILFLPPPFSPFAMTLGEYPWLASEAIVFVFSVLPSFISSLLPSFFSSFLPFFLLMQMLSFGGCRW